MASDGRRFYAHTREDQPPSTWQPLREHLEAVAGTIISFSSLGDVGTHPLSRGGCLEL